MTSYEIMQLGAMPSILELYKASKILKMLGPVLKWCEAPDIEKGIALLIKT